MTSRILPGMPTTDLDPDAAALLRVVAELHERHEVPTVQAAAIGAGLTYMRAYELVNTLFTEGLLSPDLKVTEAGTKALT